MGQTVLRCVCGHLRLQRTLVLVLIHHGQREALSDAHVE